jgi:hypothetical protein
MYCITQADPLAFETLTNVLTYILTTQRQTSVYTDRCYVRDRILP